MFQRAAILAPLLLLATGAVASAAASNEAATLSISDAPIATPSPPINAAAQKDVGKEDSYDIDDETFDKLKGGFYSRYRGGNDRDHDDFPRFFYPPPFKFMRGYQRGNFGFRRYKRQFDGFGFDDSNFNGGGSNNKWGMYGDKKKSNSASGNHGPQSNNGFSDGGSGYVCSGSTGSKSNCRGYGKYGRLGGKKDDKSPFAESENLETYFDSGAFDANFQGPGFGGFGGYGGLGGGFGGFGF